MTLLWHPSICSLFIRGTNKEEGTELSVILAVAFTFFVLANNISPETIKRRRGRKFSSCIRLLFQDLANYCYEAFNYNLLPMALPSLIIDIHFLHWTDMLRSPAEQVSRFVVCE